MKKLISLLLAACMIVLFAGVFASAKTPGDVNGDGEVNNKDVVTLFRYVSAGTNSAGESAYDFNGDGEVNNKDVVALFRAVSSGTEPVPAEEQITDKAEEETAAASEEETDPEQSADAATETGTTADMTEDEPAEEITDEAPSEDMGSEEPTGDIPEEGPEDETTEAESSYDTTAEETPGDISDHEPTDEITEEETADEITEKETMDEITEKETTDEITEEEPADDTAETEPEETEAEKELVICAPGSYASKFSVVYDKKAETPLTAEANMLTNMIRNYTGTWIYTADSSKNSKKEIILSSSVRSETAQMMDELEEGEYAVRVLRGEADGEGKLLIASTTYASARTCAEYLMKTYCSDEKGFCVPYDLNIKGRENTPEIIESTITRKMRDPFMLVEDGVYYVYSTGWKCSKNVSGNIKGPWKKLEIEVNLAHPETDGESHWAPEVHKYNGAYYMFTTYYNSVTDHRGCIILKSDSPEGPFNEITDGFITPADWDSIDGTFYVDPDGQPWMVFVHEWTCMPDGVGSFAAAKLSDDLTHFISEPIELFKANEPVWARANVTDGCFMYTAENGDLLMLWSNFDAFGYAVAVARSSNGRLDGEWIHEKDLLYSKCLTNGYDGGHAMIFTDTDGQMYIAFHSPNTATDDRKEIPVFMAIEEKDGRLFRVENEADGG